MATEPHGKTRNISAFFRAFRVIPWRFITMGPLSQCHSITANYLLGFPASERLPPVADLWDSIAEVPDASELSEDQCVELDRRLEAYHDAPEIGSPWKDVKERILKYG